jgi:hypothetical protein
MPAHGLGADVLVTFAATYLVASLALLGVGIETTGLQLEQITGAEPVPGRA